MLELSCDILHFTFSCYEKLTQEVKTKPVSYLKIDVNQAILNRPVPEEKKAFRLISVTQTSSDTLQTNQENWHLLCMQTVEYACLQFCMKTMANSLGYFKISAFIITTYYWFLHLQVPIFSLFLFHITQAPCIPSFIFLFRPRVLTLPFAYHRLPVSVTRRLILILVLVKLMLLLLTR